MTLDARLQVRLAERQAALLYRQHITVESACEVEQLAAGAAVVNFCSNDYLGLANSARVKAAVKSAVDEVGFGSGASHLVSGHSVWHHKLECALAQMTQRPRALLFSTGYMANIALVTSLLENGQVVIGDKLNHASLVDAAQLACANQKKSSFLRYKHVDLADLERQLKKASEGALVLTDGVFSMDGDIAPLAALSSLCRQYNAFLAVDDAHGFGCLGPNGGGSVLAAGLNVDDVPIYMGTLGKAVGGFGAFIAGSEALIESLIQFARPYIYTTALPPAVAVGNYTGVSLLRDDPSYQACLLDNIMYFQQMAKRYLPCDGKAALLPSDTAIQPLVLGTQKRVMAVSARLLRAGYWVGAIRPPTVPVGTARLRITLSAAHSKCHIEGLWQALAVALKAAPE